MQNESRESPIEAAETALVKARANVEYDSRSAQPPPGVVEHGPHVVVDPLAPVMTRTVAPEVLTDVDLVARVAELETENAELRRVRDEHARRIVTLEKALSPESF